MVDENNEGKRKKETVIMMLLINNVPVMYNDKCMCVDHDKNIN